MKTIPFAVARWAAVAVLISGLAACATAPKKPPVDDYAALMSKAEVEVSGLRLESALAIFTQAAKADPTRKEPWLRSAQVQFDAGNYGRAIVAAEEALQRDPGDPVADSVLTVSGLRVAAQSLQRLRSNGALASSSATREAEQLADALRATMGPEILAPPRAAKATPKRRASSRASAPAAKPAGKSPEAAPGSGKAVPASNDPFSALGGG